MRKHPEMTSTPLDPDKRVLLILRTPPPYGGGEMIALSLLEAFRSTYDVLEFSRVRHSKQTQGRLTAGNLRFGLTYIFVSACRILRTRPRAVYIDIPKDFPSFVRTSPILLLARVLRVAVVGDLAGAAFPFIEEDSWKKRLGMWILRPVFAIRVLSPSLASRLNALGLSNAVSVSNGISCEAAESGRDHTLPHVPQLLYVGKLSPAKGLWTLLGFLESCHARGHEVHMHLVGEWESPALGDEVRAWIRDRGLEPLLTIHGLLVGDAKWDVYRRATALVHPTFWDGQPVTMLEAFAFGLPVIATPIGAIPDTVEDGKSGYLMKENSAEELYQGIHRIMADAEVYSRFASEARRAYDTRFRREIFVRHMDELLRKARDSRTPRLHR